MALGLPRLRGRRPLSRALPGPAPGGERRRHRHLGGGIRQPRPGGDRLRVAAVQLQLRRPRGHEPPPLAALRPVAAARRRRLRRHRAGPGARRAPPRRRWSAPRPGRAPRGGPVRLRLPPAHAAGQHQPAPGEPRRRFQHLPLGLRPGPGSRLPARGGALPAAGGRTPREPQPPHRRPPAHRGLHRRRVDHPRGGAGGRLRLLRRAGLAAARRRRAGASARGRRGRRRLPGGRLRVPGPPRRGDPGGGGVHTPGVGGRTGGIAALPGGGPGPAAAGSGRHSAPARPQLLRRDAAGAGARGDRGPRGGAAGRGLAAGRAPPWGEPPRRALPHLGDGRPRPAPAGGGGRALAGGGRSGPVDAARRRLRRAAERRRRRPGGVVGLLRLEGVAHAGPAAAEGHGDRDLRRRQRDRGGPTRPASRAPSAWAAPAAHRADRPGGRGHPGRSHRGVARGIRAGAAPHRPGRRSGVVARSPPAHRLRPRPAGAAQSALLGPRVRAAIDPRRDLRGGPRADRRRLRDPSFLCGSRSSASTSPAA